MNRRETERIVRSIQAARQAGERVALATIVRVRGSAYRREGARILVREDRSYECLLSGGCLETSVADAAARVLATGRPAVVEYDLEEDSVWSVGIGCSGAVDIYIERVEDDPITRNWVDVLERAEPAVLVKSLSDSQRLLVREASVDGTLGDDVLDKKALAEAQIRLRAPLPESGTARLAGVELFFEVNLAAPDLVVFGANSDAVPLARYAWELGFVVTVVDVREAFLRADRFPGATVVLSHFSRFRELVRLTDRSFVIIMNHHLERDRESLRFALQSEARYVGVLGPSARLQKLLTALAAQDFIPDGAAMTRVRNPVGLALGAETPEEIAVSILGEILAVQRGFDGGFLAGRTAGLHHVRSNRALARS